MIEDDGDEVRAVGFIAIHAAHLEARIHNLLVLLSPITPYPEEEQRWQISRKIEACKKRLSKLADESLADLMDDLDRCKEHFEWRNEILHSQLFSPEYNEKNLKSMRPGVKPRATNAIELYTLANNLRSLDSALYRPQIFDIPRLIIEYQEANQRILHKTQIKDGHVTWPFEYSLDLRHVNCPRCLELIKSGR